MRIAHVFGRVDFLNEKLLSLKEAKLAQTTADSVLDFTNIKRVWQENDDFITLSYDNTLTILRRKSKNSKEFSKYQLKFEPFNYVKGVFASCNDSYQCILEQCQIFEFQRPPTTCVRVNTLFPNVKGLYAHNRYYSAKQIKYSDSANLLQLPSTDEVIDKVSYDSHFFFVLTTNGTLYRGTSYRHTLQKDLENVAEVGTALNACLVRTKSNEYYALGKNTYGQMFDAGVSTYNFHRLKIKMPESVTSIHMSGVHSVFLTKHNEVLGVGKNQFKQISRVHMSNSIKNLMLIASFSPKRSVEVFLTSGCTLVVVSENRTLQSEAIVMVQRKLMTDVLLVTRC